MQDKIRPLYRFAITRTPGENFREGITTAGLGKPQYRRALLQHAAYIEALRAAGLEVILLAPDPRFPDGCFVEDTAVVLPEIAVISNPGASSRAGETEEMKSVLSQFRRPAPIEPPGTLEGGDVLRVERRFFIGLSRRTNEEGIRQFARIVGQFGYSTKTVKPGPFLHLKSGLAYIGDNRLVAAPAMAAMEEFSGYEIITTRQEEAYAANCLRMAHGTIAIANGHPHITQSIQAAGYGTVELEMTEFQKMDGGLTCLSLLF